MNKTYKMFSCDETFCPLEDGYIAFKDIFKCKKNKNFKFCKNCKCKGEKVFCKGVRLKKNE